MSWIEIILIGAGLQLDVFAYALCRGAVVGEVDKKSLVILGGGFTLWNLISLTAGNFVAKIPVVSKNVEYAANDWKYISVAIFLGLGIYLIIKAARGKEIEERKAERLESRQFAMWMAITSLDVFIAGIGFGFLDTVFFKTFIVILLITPVSVIAGLYAGWWAAEYGHLLNLSFEDMDRVITQGKELGIYLYMLTGGEPLVRKKDIIRLCEKHNDCEFHAFTNGTLVDEEFCNEMERVGNLTLSISLEGYEKVNDGRRGKGVYEKVMHAMDLLKAHGQIFGTSICYTRANIETVTSDEFLDMIIEKGCRYAWYFHYMPVGNDAAVDLLPTKEQREYMYHRVREIRGFTGGKQIFAFDFQNDGEYVGGCIAGGRNYFHINANGDAEPCVFIHYSSANIKEVSVLDALRQPLFMAYHNNQPFNKNHLRPCPMLENPEKLQQMVHETGAKSTDLQSPESVEHLCGKCEQYASIWKKKADELWEKSGKAEKEEKKA